MNYKTIVLELIEANPALHEELRSTGQLLTALDSHAVQFRSRHLELAKTMDKGQAFEIATAEIVERLLPSEFPLDEAMQYVKDLSHNG